MYLISFLVIAFAHWVYRWRNPKCKGLLPPGSMGFPIVGESIQFFTSHSLKGIPPFIQQRTARYGSLFKTCIVGQRVIVSTDPEVNHFIFQQEGGLVQCWYSESSAEITGRQGFLGHHGDSHKYIRNLAHSLVGPENLKQTLLAEMDKTTRQHLDQWTGLSKLDIKQATEIMLFKLAASKVLSYDEKKALELRKYYKDFHEGFISFPLFLPGTSFYAAMQEEHEKIVASRKDKESSITWKEYKSMKFTHMVINETVRLANIVPGIFRKVIEDFQIKGKWKVVDEGNIVQKPGLAFLDGFKVQIYK
nr:cytochrome P450 87A3-like [Ipomoea batatas]